MLNKNREYKKDFKKCKEIFENYSNGNMTQEDFNKWSKENCDNCFFYKITGKKYCLFGGKNSRDVRKDVK